MFEQFLKVMIMGSLFEDPVFKSMMEEAGCSTCDEPDCPIAQMVNDDDTIKVSIEPGVTPLGQFPDDILAGMAEGLEEARKEVAKENGYGHHLYFVVRDELLRVKAEIEQRDPLYPVKEMVKAISKTFGKPQHGDLPEYTPEVKMEGEDAVVRILMPSSNNDWARKVTKWANQFIKRYNGTWLSYRESNDPMYTYICVPNNVILKWKREH